VHASLVLRNGLIHTLDPAHPRATALAAFGEHVLALDDVDHLVGPQTLVLDLGGRTAVPGLIDAHVHLLWFGETLGQVDLSGAGSIEEAVERAARHRPDGEWVRGWGYDPNVWPRWPTRHDLDRLLPERPAALWSHDLHSLWVNGAALRRAGVTRDTPTPEGGHIFKGEDGEPTGVLQERAANLVLGAIGPLSPEACDAATRRAIRKANEHGIVGVHTKEGAAARASVQRLREDGDLTLRVYAHLAREELDAAIALGLRTGIGDDWVRLGGLKLFADGSLGSQTALMIEPFAGSDNRGVEVLTPDQLADFAERACSNGIALTIHAIGDLANRRVLDALEVARQAEARARRMLVEAGRYPVSARGRAAARGGEAVPSSRSSLRHRIEHAQHLAPADIARLAGVVASVQPIHATSDMHTADRYLGQRTTTSFAWRSLLEAGARLAFGTDAPVEPIDPIRTIHAAVTRRRADGSPGPDGWHPEQRLTTAESLHAYTLGSAYAAGEEACKGSLIPGKLADVTVLSADPLETAPDELLGIKVEATIVGGRIVVQSF
jgi:predicted amidohydrolase YtcJ